MSRPLVILGTGGKAYELLDIIDAINAQRKTWEVVGFLDDTRPLGSQHLDFEILGGLRDAGQLAHYTYANAIGNEKSFRRLPEILAKTDLVAERFATLIHPLATVSSRAKLGHGITINHGVSISGGVTIGNHVSFCAGCIIGHDSIIDDYCILAPGAIISGFVHLNQSVYVGAGAMIRQRVYVGEHALVGMGAVVLRPVRPGDVIVGNPGRSLEPVCCNVATEDVSDEPN